MAFIYDLSDTFSNASTTFTSIKMDVTDTASAAASRLIALQVGGTDKFTVRKDGQGYFAGNLGVGTESPDTLMELVAANPILTIRDTETSTSAADARLRLAESGASDTLNNYWDVGILSGAAISLGFSYNGAEKVRIDSSGNVGIGTVSPSRPLDIDVAGTSALRLTDSSTPTTYAEIISANGTLSLSADGGNAVGSSNIQFDVDASELMRLNSTGLGIGTTSPSYKLQIEDTLANTYVQVTSSTTAVAGLLLGDTNNRTVGRISYDNSDNSLALYSNNFERMRIDSSGNVGIGLTTIDSTGYVNLETAKNIRMDMKAVGADPAIYFDHDNFSSNTNNFISLKRTSEAMAFQVAGSERMRIDSSGNVGIGTSSPASKLDVAGTTPTLTISDTQNKTWTTSDTTLGELAFRTRDSSGIGAHDVAFIRATNEANSTTPSGALSFGVSEKNNAASESMRLTDSGLLGIGTSSPATITSGITALSISDSGAKTTGDKIGELNFVTNDGSFTGTFSDGIGAAINAVSTSATGAAYALTFTTATTSGSNRAERLRITETGNVLVGTTSNSLGNSGFKISGTAPGFARSERAGSTSSQTHISFANANGDVGSIGTSGTTTSYNTSSDARLKHDIVDAPEASDLIDGIQVRSFKWNIDNSEQRYGMVAQELVEVAPEAVTGEPDSDEMMAVDYSKLVPMLVKEVQSLRKRVAELEGK